MSPWCLGLALGKVSLPNLTDHGSHLVEAKDFGRVLVGPVDFSRQGKLQPHPILDARLDVLELSSAEIATSDDLVASRAVRVRRLLGRASRPRCVLAIDPHLVVPRQATVLGTGVVGEVADEITREGLEGRLVVVDVLDRFFEMARSQEVVDDDPAVVVSQLSQLRVVLVDLFPRRSEGDVGTDLVDRRRDPSETGFSRESCDKGLQLLHEPTASMRQDMIEGGVGGGPIYHLQLLQVASGAVDDPPFHLRRSL